MEITVSEQLSSCLAHLVLGLLAGAVYDLVRIIHICIKPSGESARVNKICFSSFVFVLDVLYCIVIGICFAVTSFVFFYGKFRAFNVFSFSVGFTVYILTLGRLLMFFSNRFVCFIKYVLRIILKIMLIPFRYLLKGLSYLVNIIYRFTVGWFISRIRLSKENKYFENVLSRLSEDVKI